jgi:hypothetical protein
VLAAGARDNGSKQMQAIYREAIERYGEEFAWKAMQLSTAHMFDAFADDVRAAAAAGDPAALRFLGEVIEPMYRGNLV